MPEKGRLNTITTKDMNVKKYCFPAAAVLLAAGFSSCSDLDNPVSTQTSSIAVSQFVIPDDPDGEVTFENNVMYCFSSDHVAGTIAVTLNNNRYAFTSDVMKYNGAALGNMQTVSFGPGSGRSNAGGVIDIEGFMTTSYYYYVTTPMLYPGFYASSYTALVCQTKLDGVTLKTFSRDTFFRGSTTPYVAGRPLGSPTTSPVYRAVLSADMKTANVVIYNMQFTSQMPALEAVVLEGLSVKYGRDGYEVYLDTPVVTKVLEGGALTEYKQFNFISFSLKTTSDDLTKVKADYEVAATIGDRAMDFSAQFEGGGPVNLLSEKFIGD